jgi:hypothetical protein
MCVVAELRAVDVRSSHQFEEEIGAASKENELYIVKMEFSVWTCQLGGGGAEMTLATGAFRRPAIVRCIQFYPIAIKLPDVRK